MNTNYAIKEIDEIINNIAKIRLSNSKESLKLSKHSLELSCRVNYEFGKFMSLYRIAEAYVFLGNYEQALDIVFKPLDFFIAEGFYDLQCNIYNLIGIIFSELGDFEKSTDFFAIEEELSSQVDLGKKYDCAASSNHFLATALNNIAENYKHLKDYDRALKYYNKSYSIDKLQDFKGSRGMVLLSLGEIYYILNDYEKANTFANESLKYFNLYNYTIPKSSLYHLLALISWKKNDISSSYDWFNKALNMKHDQQLSPLTEIEILINFYKFLDDQKNFKEAINKLHEAHNLSLEYNMLKKTPEVSGLLAIFYEREGNFEASYKYFKMHYEYEKSLFDSLDKFRINTLNVRLKLKQIENEKKEIAANNENLKRKSKELESLAEKISIISELGQKITSVLELDSLTHTLYSSIDTFINMNYFCVGLYDEERNVVEYLDSIEDGKKIKVATNNLSNAATFSSYCIKNSKVIVVNDLANEYSKYLDPSIYNNITKKNNYILNSVIFCPLTINNKVIGVMTIQSKEKNAFSPYQVEMVKSLCSYISIAVNNALKSRELEIEIEKRKEAQIELQRLNKKLLYLSENDSLTGIANRRKLDNYLDNIWAKSISEASSLALILFDIDYFKEYNDNYGHIEGDNCLIKVANALSSLCEDIYFPARYGGDEFMVVLNNCPKEEALRFAHNLINKIAVLNIPHEFSKVMNIVTNSIGITSIIPSTNMNINDFIKKADAALYLAKERGKNQIAVI